MKKIKELVIHPPKLPKRFEIAKLTSLEDDDEYVGSKITVGNLAGQTVKNVIFEESLLQRITLTGARLPKLRLRDVRLENCDISAAFLERCRLRRVEFVNCRLLGVQMLAAQLDDVLFKECNLEGAVFASAEVKSLRFEKCMLKNATFEDADMDGVTIDQCDLSYADLRNVKTKNADLRGSILGGMQIDAQTVKGIVISPEQAIQMVSLLGVIVEDDHFD